MNQARSWFVLWVVWGATLSWSKSNTKLLCHWCFILLHSPPPGKKTLHGPQYLPYSGSPLPLCCLYPDEYDSRLFGAYFLPQVLPGRLSIFWEMQFCCPLGCIYREPSKYISYHALSLPGNTVVGPRQSTILLSWALWHWQRRLGEEREVLGPIKWV